MRQTLLGITSDHASKTMSSAFRALGALLALVLPLGQTSLAWADDAAPRMALGVIVKLKSSTAQPTSVIRLQATSRDEEGSTRARSRLAALSARRHVGYTVQKPTAFAAHVIHSGSVMPYAQAQAQAARLRADPDVEWVVVNEVLQAASATTTALAVDPSQDPGYPQQTWLQSRSQMPAAADFPAAWALMAGKPVTPVVVAVLDSGVLKPADLDGRMLPGYDFVSQRDFSRDGDGLDSDPTDPGDWLTEADKASNPQLFANAACELKAKSNWHGLSVSYMLAAATGNGLDGAGILAPLPGPVLLPVRVAGNCGASLSDTIEGMLWAAGVDYQGSPPANPSPARVINFSFGSVESCGNPTRGTTAWLYQQTIATLKSKGTLLVASAGNGNSASLGMSGATMPANCPGVLAVTGLNPQGYKARYANMVDAGQHSAVAVASGDIYLASDGQIYLLPGSGIASMINAGEQAPTAQFNLTSDLAGTSFAAPMAAGVAALMMTVDPTLTVDEVLAVLTDQSGQGGATPFPAGPLNGLTEQCSATNPGNCLCTTQTCGAGMLDARGAVAWALANAPAHATTADASGLYASYFTPTRVTAASSNNAPSGGGGGGGAVDAVTLLALGGLLAWRQARPKA